MPTHISQTPVGASNPSRKVTRAELAEHLGVSQRYIDNLFSPDPMETKDYFIFVHGWNMPYLGSTNYAETMFKRLWWRGYKGRFAAFRWPTYYWSDDFPSLDPYGASAVSAALARYNDSEYIAWESGQALAQYVNSLPSAYTRHIAAHSMGNVVVASAFQQPAPMSVGYYAALHAAIPAYCFDSTTTSLEQTYGIAMGYSAPDYDPDPATSSLAYSGRVANDGGAVIINFCDASDAALKAWESNNKIEKPQLLHFGITGFYFYNLNNPNGEKLGLGFHLINGRYMTDKYEAMAYADKSFTKTMGADSRTKGLVNSFVDTDLQYSFGTDHSAEFSRPLGELQDYYYDLLKNLKISENYLDAGHVTYTP